MNRTRLIRWLVAALAGLAAGAAVSVLAVAIARSVLGRSATGGNTDPALIGIGYLAWVLCGLVVSAATLYRRRGPR